MFKRGYWAWTKIQKPYFLVGSEQVTFFFFSVACKFFGWFRPGILLRERERDMYLVIGRLIKTMCIVYLVNNYNLLKNIYRNGTETSNFTPWANAQS